MAKLKHYKRFGGYLQYKQMLRNSKQMEEASLNLPPVQSFTDGPPVYFLTGKNHLYQTLFCIQSLTKISREKFSFILVDDGSFDEALIARVSRQLPGAVAVTQQEIAENLRQILPVEKYPVLNHKRSVYPHLKKLTDVHTLPGSRWKMVLDSDMLFWSEPKDVINWLKKPEQNICMLDCEQSYGYSIKLMESLCGQKIRAKVNVGAIGLANDAINWDDLEKWISILEEKEGANYYLEQALSAMLIGDAPLTILNSSDYIVNPDEQAILNKAGVLHHYVDLAKKGYFQSAWKMVIGNTKVKAN
ncbi:hypothetical protein [Mucilaginibacter sp.]|uniref:hypothetical protein n=1 Tax=Mucilaginibacter sp. TaxID=1882438 RepID=UPI0032663ECC